MKLDEKTITLSILRKVGVEIGPGVKRLIPHREGVSPREFIRLPLDSFLEHNRRILAVEYRLRVLLTLGVLPESICVGVYLLLIDEALSVYEYTFPGDPRIRRALEVWVSWSRGEVNDEELIQIKRLAWFACEAAWGACMATTRGDSRRDGARAATLLRDVLDWLSIIQGPEILFQVKKIRSDPGWRRDVFDRAYLHICEKIPNQGVEN